MQAARLLLLVSVLVAGCASPLVNFTQHQTPTYPKEQFDQHFALWKSGRNATWEVRYKGTSFSEDELVISSDGQGSLGARLPTGGKQAQAFTVPRAELGKLVDKLVASNIFGLWDGHYGAWTQGGGVGGAEIRVLAGNLEKRVSKDPGLSTTLSWESASIQAASDAILELSRKYIK
jgi:hypothetical protein